MITETYFKQIVKELLAEYLPKSKKAERKEVAAALADELRALGFDFEDSFDSDNSAVFEDSLPGGKYSRVFQDDDGD